MGRSAEDNSLSQNRGGRSAGDGTSCPAGLSKAEQILRSAETDREKYRSDPDALRSAWSELAYSAGGILRAERFRVCRSELSAEALRREPGWGPLLDITRDVLTTVKTIRTEQKLDILWKIAELGFGQFDGFDVLVEKEVARIEKLNIREVLALARVCARVPIHRINVPEEIAEQYFRLYFPSMKDGAQSATALVGAFREWGYCPGKLERLVPYVLRPQIAEELSDAELSNLWHAVVTFRWEQKFDLSPLADRSLGRFRSLGTRYRASVGRLVTASVPAVGEQWRAAIESDQDFPARYPAKALGWVHHMDLLSGRCRNNEIDGRISGCIKARAEQLYDVESRKKTVTESILSEILNRIVKKSSGTISVARTGSIHGVEPDAVVHINGRAVAIELDGPHHFINRSSDPEMNRTSQPLWLSGFDLMQDRIMIASGHGILHIPFDEFELMRRANRERRSKLVAMLAHAGATGSVFGRFGSATVTLISSPESSTADTSRESGGPVNPESPLVFWRDRLEGEIKKRRGRAALGEDMNGVVTVLEGIERASPRESIPLEIEVGRILRRALMALPTEGMEPDSSGIGSTLRAECMGRRLFFAAAMVALAEAHTLRLTGSGLERVRLEVDSACLLWDQGASSVSQVVSREVFDLDRSALWKRIAEEAARKNDARAFWECTGAYFRAVEDSIESNSGALFGSLRGELAQLINRAVETFVATQSDVEHLDIARYGVWEYEHATPEEGGSAQRSRIVQVCNWRHQLLNAALGMGDVTGARALCNEQLETGRRNRELIGKSREVQTTIGDMLTEANRTLSRLPAEDVREESASGG